MKAAAALGMMLAFFFGVIALNAISGLQVDADTAGIPGAAGDFFDNAMTLFVILMGGLGILAVTGGIVIVSRR